MQASLSRTSRCRAGIIIIGFTIHCCTRLAQNQCRWHPQPQTSAVEGTGGEEARITGKPCTCTGLPLTPPELTNDGLVPPHGHVSACVAEGGREVCAGTQLADPAFKFPPRRGLGAVGA